MDFDQELRKVAVGYESQGYQVVIRPAPEQLPSFAKDFKVEILARRGLEGVLVAVKKTRDELEADTQLQRYAEVTSAQPGWRFDLAVLEGANPMGRNTGDIHDLSEEDIERSLANADQIASLGIGRAAIMTAWAALESAMRMRLRAAGERADWGMSPRAIMNEMVSSGYLSLDEFRRLEGLANLRNQIVHGFSSPTTEGGLNGGVVPFLSEVTRRLLRESQPVKQRS